MKNILHLVAFTAGMVCFTASAGFVHVAKTGSNDGDGSAANPYATIQKAADEAAAGDVIRIAGGIYDESVTLHTYRHVSGSWNDSFTAQDLRNGRTVIRSTSTSKPAIAIAAETGTNSIDAVTLTGGSAGLQSRANGGANDSNDYYMPLSRLIVTNNVNGLDFNGGFNAAHMSACLVADNTGYGYRHDANHGTASFVLNCTFARNNQAIYRSGTYISLIRVRNSIFSGNSTAFYLTTDFSSFYVDRSLLHGNGTRIDWTSGTQANWSKFRYLEGIVYGDPKLGADFAPTAGSAAIGRGLDVTEVRKFESGSAVAGSPVVTTDVYGAPFDGTDLGCVKASVMASPRLPDVYVATTGDDTNSGADAAHPKRSINNAVTLLADGGVCHVADGTYVEAVALGVTNVTLVGESVAGTVIKSESGTNGRTKDFAVGVFAPRVVVSNLTCAASGMGVLVSPSLWNVTSTMVARAVLTGNCFGFYNAGTSRGDYLMFLSHVQVRDSLEHGIYTYNVMRIDNTLIADNGKCGIYSDTWNLAGSFYLNNVTVTGNGTYGYYFNNGYSPGVFCYNSIFQGNHTYGVYAAKGNFTAYSCCFHGNGNNNENTGVTYNSSSSIFTDPLLDATATLRGRLAEGSPCAQSGGNYSEISQVPSTSDLDYMRRLTDRMDMGCYISPETMNDLAGDGYHIVSIEGYPNGYGTPSPDYGRNLLEEGNQRLSVVPTLYTEEVDGIRASRVKDGSDYSDGVRAAYKGYVYKAEGATEPTEQSDTDEYCDITLAANGTMTWKWERQNRIIVSTDAAGCTVKINDGPAAACVTNWIKEGTSYTITFIPTSDFSFDSWEGDFPESADPRYVTTAVQCDRPRAIQPKYRPLVHVSSVNGDDDTGDGTQANPFATINRGIAAATKGGVIYVQEGTYTEAVVNTTLDELTISGGYDANWQRNLLNSRSIINPGNASADCLTLDGVVSNTVKGLTLTGGKNGVRLGGPVIDDKTVDWSQKVLVNHNLEQLVVTNNAVDGITYVNNDRHGGLRLVSSYVAGNHGCGIHWVSTDRCAVYVHNCTISGNGGRGIYFEGAGYPADIRNTVVADNGGPYAVECSGTYLRLFAKRCIFLGGDRFAVRYNPGGNSYYYPRGGVLFTDPQLDGNGVPTAASPCVKSGENLHFYSLHAELEDIYDHAWNGEYDIGCFKTSYEAPQKLADVYVAPAGNDGNAGTAEAPLRTLSRAALRVAENGTVHAAEGVYEERVSLDVRGMTLAGAGRGKTVISAIGTSKEDCSSYYTVHAAADNVVIRDLSACGNTNGTGVLLGFSAIATNACVIDCALDGNRNGAKFDTYEVNDRSIYVFPDEAVNAKRCYHHVSRCTLTDNVETGFLITGFGRGWIIGDNLLVARNGGNGISAHELSGNSVYTYDYFYNCTIADNELMGVRTGGDGDTAEIDLVNSIVTGNKSYGIYRAAYNRVNAKNSIVAGNGTDLSAKYPVDYQGTDSIIGGDATDLVKRAPGCKSDYTLPPGSSARGFARAMTASDRIAEPLLDLAGNPRRNKDGKRDAGCFASQPFGTVFLMK